MVGILRHEWHECDVGGGSGREKGAGGSRGWKVLPKSPV